MSPTANGGRAPVWRTVADTARDRGLIRGLLTRASDEALYQRFQYVRRAFPDPWLSAVFCSNDPGALTLIGLLNGRAVALGHYARTAGAGAEFDLLVEDSLQHRGIGAELLQRLARAAAADGIARLEAAVLRANTPMLHLLQHSGLAADWDTDRDVVRVALSLPSPRHPPRPLPQAM